MNRFLFLMIAILSMPTHNYSQPRIPNKRSPIVAIPILGVASYYLYKMTKQEFLTARNWNLQEELKKQQEKEANAQSLWAKFKAKRDSYFVRTGQYSHYTAAATYGIFGAITGVACGACAVRRVFFTD